MNSSTKGKSTVLWIVIIILSLAALTAGVLGSSGTSGINFGKSFGRNYSKNVPAEKADINIEKSFRIEGISLISINTVSEDISIIPSQTDEVKVHFYGNTSHKQAAPELLTDISGDVLTVKLKHTTSIIFGLSQNFKLDIYIPEEYTARIDTNTVSANVNTCSLKVSDFTCYTVSGEFYSEGIKASGVTLGTTSGSFKIDAVCEKFSFDTTSGDLKCGSLISSNTVINAVSGNINAESFTGALKHSSISGNLTLNCPGLDGDISSNTVSGDVRINLPSSSEFYLDFSSTSGSVNNEFPITVTGQSKGNKLRGTVGSDKNKIVVDTVSGDLTIKSSTLSPIS